MLISIRQGSGLSIVAWKESEATEDVFLNKPCLKIWDNTMLPRNTVLIFSAFLMRHKQLNKQSNKLPTLVKILIIFYCSCHFNSYGQKISLCVHYVSTWNICWASVALVGILCVSCVWMALHASLCMCCVSGVPSCFSWVCFSLLLISTHRSL